MRISTPRRSLESAWIILVRDRTDVSAPSSRRHGLPPLRHSEPGLASLLRIVTDQLISLKAGEAIWNRLARTSVAVRRPDAIAACGFDQLKRSGPVRCEGPMFPGGGRALMRQARSTTTCWHRLVPMKRPARLMAIRGIGPWTADIYLLIGSPVRRCLACGRSCTAGGGAGSVRSAGAARQPRTWIAWPQAGGPTGPPPPGCCGAITAG